jgi:hypothetical protein
MQVWNSLLCIIVLPGVGCELISTKWEWGKRLPFQHLVEIKSEGGWNNR